MNMDPSKIPFNALIVGPTNSGKSRFVVDQLYGPFRFKFDYIVLICPTFTHNKTYHRLGENDPRMDVIVCDQHDVEIWLKLVRWLSEGTNTLIILDDCAASKDVKGRTGELVNLAFSARHMGISVWALTQKMTGITASFRENVAAIGTKEQAKQNFTNTDYAFKLYNQAHPDERMIPPKEPKFSDFYQPSEQQKRVNSRSWAPALSLWATRPSGSFKLFYSLLIWTPNSQRYTTTPGAIGKESPRSKN